MQPEEIVRWRGGAAVIEMEEGEERLEMEERMTQP